VIDDQGRDCLFSALNLGRARNLKVNRGNVYTCMENPRGITGSRISGLNKSVGFQASFRGYTQMSTRHNIRMRGTRVRRSESSTKSSFQELRRSGV